jgi:hypothetical protein
MSPTNEILDMIREANAKIAAISERLDRMEARQAAMDAACQTTTEEGEPS